MILSYSVVALDLIPFRNGMEKKKRRTYRGRPKQKNWLPSLSDSIAWMLLLATVSFLSIAVWRYGW